MTAGQQHAWQLTLDPERTRFKPNQNENLFLIKIISRAIFTTQPTDHSYKHDMTWVGGVLPKLAQYKNTLIGKLLSSLKVSCFIFYENHGLLNLSSLGLILFI